MFIASVPKRFATLLLGVSLSALFVPALAQAQSLEAALVKAYRTNPDLNAARAGLRVANEGVPAALSGYRPSVSVTASQGNSTVIAIPSSNQFNLNPKSVAVTATQTIYDGNRTTNTVRLADQNVMVAREDLRNREQTVLLASATAYMNVLRDQATLELQQRNVEVLREQLRFTRDRFQVGEVTRTDVAQAESRLQLAISTASAATANLATSRAVYRQQIGEEAGRRLPPARTAERYLPKDMQAAISSGLSRHPSVQSAEHGADAALVQVRIAESALYPTLTASASATRAVEQSVAAPGESQVYALTAALTVPIFANGGRDYATIRQSKETAGQRRIQVDIARESVRQAVVQSWGGLEASRAQINAAEAQVKAAQIALNGIREEAKVGQRTTLDVLNAQQELTNARVALVTAQRDRVVQSYSVLAAMGKLSAENLSLKTELFDPTQHYEQVRDKWIGIRTPDGR